MLPRFHFPRFILARFLGGSPKSPPRFCYPRFLFCFASKALAVDNIRHSRPLRPHSFGHCLLTARQFMRGVQLPRGSWHSLRSYAVWLPCQRGFPCIQFTWNALPNIFEVSITKKSIPTPSHRNVAKHLIACRRYFRFLILYLNETLQSESGMCLPKRCRAQACFREALWNFLYLS